VSKVQFVKWLFLLKEEENIDRYVSFYGFFPYKYGPFSFLAYKDVAELERFGWIKSNSSSFRYTAPKKVSAELELLPSILRSVERIIENYGGLSQQSLLRYVYEKYPWYASRSKIGQSSSIYSTRARPAVYSLGYEGLSIDGFLDVVLKAGIQMVIDSRYNPISRKYGFSKSSLANKCHYVGTRYHQFSEMGIPSKIRSQIQDRQALWDFYTEEILSRNSEVLESIANICMSDPSVLICFERKPEDCHRHIIARELSIRTRLPIVHYVEGRWKKSGREDKDSYNRQDLSHTVEQV
jgi:uncharacterized protein (DUF488 family)